VALFGELFLAQFVEHVEFLGQAVDELVAH
jgi:hypothetical protein